MYEPSYVAVRENFTFLLDECNFFFAVEARLRSSRFVCNSYSVIETF